MEKLYLLTQKALKCLPNTFSECDEKVTRLQKEIKSLKAQIEDIKGLKEGHGKQPRSARRFEKTRYIQKPDK